jgi:hypothetical protein
VWSVVARLLEAANCAARERAIAHVHHHGGDFLSSSSESRKRLSNAHFLHAQPAAHGASGALLTALRRCAPSANAAPGTPDLVGKKNFEDLPGSGARMGNRKMKPLESALNDSQHRPLHRPGCLHF